MRQDAGQALMRLVWGYTSTGLVVAAMRLELPDRLASATRSTVDLADEMGVHEPSLRRLLRALTAIGLTSETSAGHYALTPVGALLRKDVPDSLHAVVRVSTDETILRGWRDLDWSVRTGQTAFDRIHGTDFFAHIAENAELSALFNASMGAGTTEVAEAVTKHYDFSRFGTVVDVGGGNGTLLAPILAAEPELRGIVFDSEEGVEQAAGVLADAGVADRCEIVAGDFFRAVPRADLYLLKNILHDWDDTRSAAILANCRAAIPEHGRLLLVESVLPATPEPGGPPDDYLMDINMLVNFGGRERTEGEFHALLTAAGFQPRHAVRVGELDDHLIEAVPVT
nr:methyltransferase [Kibdelosporangium sp. MJ126-NF4]ADB02856.1 AzicL [Kibdelosporangium sp. MJ126-NF4]CEL14087.1 O-demethylpuromycin-O-methyltransferase [Kibdelosporangium sp. MJ126-NF4]CTQ88453.1 O-demethylpuromycin-O-methyltransferase (EC 2.1.1.38) [Kibdelosporangium sp. MJ126-NF4]